MPPSHVIPEVQDSRFTIHFVIFTMYIEVTFTLKTEAACSSETLVTTCEIAVL